MDEKRLRETLLAREAQVRKLKESLEGAAQRDDALRARAKDAEARAIDVAKDLRKAERERDEWKERAEELSRRLMGVTPILQAFTRAAKGNEAFASAAELEFGVPLHEPFVSARVAADGALRVFRTGMPSVARPEAMLVVEGMRWAEEASREELRATLRYPVEGGLEERALAVQALGGRKVGDVVLIPASDAGGPVRWVEATVARVQLSPLEPAGPSEGVV